MLCSVKWWGGFPKELLFFVPTAPPAPHAPPKTLCLLFFRECALLHDFTNVRYSMLRTLRLS